MRKLFISADMEGCAAVSAPQALSPDRWSWEWTAARRWMTGDVTAAIEAAFAAQYDEVIVADGHGNAHNIDPDEMPENVRLVRSWPRPLLQMQGIEDPQIEACAFIGYHAGPSSQNSILAHA
jgi:D-amino peptidase